jgi:hypothetical protein
MLPLLEAIEEERERRYAAALREYLTEVENPEWPPWPRAEDARYHAWVRANWSELASDRFDVMFKVLDRRDKARLPVLAEDLIDLGDDLSAIAARLAADGRGVWEEGYAGSWLAWISEHWLPTEAAALERELDAVRRSLSWTGDHRARAVQGKRDELSRLEGLARCDLSLEEMEPFLKGRVCGIRGRYRVTGMTWEQRRGITQVDVDAP